MKSASAIRPTGVSATIAGSVDKLPDRSTDASFETGQVVLNNFAPGEDTTVEAVSDQYSQSSAGRNLRVTVPIRASDVSPEKVTDLGNYVLPTRAQGRGSISRTYINAMRFIAYFFGTTSSGTPNFAGSLSKAIGNPIAPGATGSEADDADGSRTTLHQIEADSRASTKKPEASNVRRAKCCRCVVMWWTTALIATADGFAGVARKRAFRS
ncbi:hypothetical protein [Salinisphaera orenii]|uniref:hypothetical protein n=1 Tax=Salinisphaera orenii TaxID=856731 RepID=UPI0013A61EEC